MLFFTSIKTPVYSKALRLGLLFLLGWAASFSLVASASASEVMGVDLERLASDVSQEEEIVRAITHALVGQGMVEKPYKSEKFDFSPLSPSSGYYQRMRTSASSEGGITISVYTGRTIREVRVNMQGIRSRLPPRASFSHDWDVVHVSNGSMQMRAGALGISVGGSMESQVRKMFCAAVYRAAMEHPIARARIEIASPDFSPRLLQGVDDGNGHLDFRTDTEAVTKVAVSKALEVMGYWNPRTRPWFYVGVLILLAACAWCAVKVGRGAVLWLKKRAEI